MNDFRDKLYLVANFGELFLKGKNISFFEKKLLQNLQEKLIDFKEQIIFEKKSGGSFYLKLDNSLEENEILKIEEIIKNTPGFSNFYRAYVCNTDLDKISETAIFLAKEEMERTKSPASCEIQTFSIKAERVEKHAKYSSLELGKKVGSSV